VLRAYRLYIIYKALMRPSCSAAQPILRFAFYRTIVASARRRRAVFRGLSTPFPARAGCAMPLSVTPEMCGVCAIGVFSALGRISRGTMARVPLGRSFPDQIRLNVSDPNSAR